MYDLSYENLIMYNATIPTYDTKKDKSTPQTPAQGKGLGFGDFIKQMKKLKGQ